ncbi:MAG TPA: amidohydrolase [Phnomibacter sp.]|nr:amidohydrolase [Phnomibacter sp.]
MRNLVMAIVALLTLMACKQSPTADLIVTNAIIWTGDAARPEVQAMVIVNDTIAAIGSNDEMEKWKGSNSTIIDAKGQFITPGFIDGHVHFITGGMGLASVQLRDAKTPSEFIQRIKAFAATVPAGTWIQGGDWDHENWGGQLPEASWIDSVTKDHPVFIIRLDGHMGLANSKAMQLAKLDASTADVAGGTIVRRAGQQPSGIFKDNAMDLVFKAIPNPSADMEDKALQAAMNYVASNGVTTVHNMGDYGGGKDIDIFQRNNQKNALITRAYVSMPLAQWSQLQTRVQQTGRGDKWVRIGVLKGFADGSLGSHTAAFFKPFTDAPKDSGFFVNSEDSLRAWIWQADKAGLQCAIHAIGDKAINSILNIFEAAEKANGTRDRRFRIEHAQHIAPTDIPRFAKLNVIPSMQPYHAIDDGSWAEKIIGSDRIKTTYAFRSLLEANAALAFGSDWFVAPPTPLEGIYAAVTRRTLDDKNPNGWVPEQKITVEEALRAYTTGAAFAGFMENDRGVLRPGMLADFVILEKDIRNIEPAAIREVKVMKTVVGGKVVFERK